MRIMDTSLKTPSTSFYNELKPYYDERILLLKRGNDGFLLDEMYETNLRMLRDNTRKSIFANHLLLLALLLTRKNISPPYIRKNVYTIKRNLDILFNYFNLKEVTDFNINDHLYPFFKGNIAHELSDSQLYQFYCSYHVANLDSGRWYDTLSMRDKEYFKKYLFPHCSFHYSDFPYMKTVYMKSKINRKAETDAIVNQLPQIRAESSLRWQKLKRMREAFRKAVKKANGEYPIDFYYDEPDRIGERYFFRLWDRRSFVLHHADQFKDHRKKAARLRLDVFKKEFVFLELIKVEKKGSSDDPVEGLWFKELIDNDLIGTFSTKDPKVAEQKNSILRSWGYEHRSKRGNAVIPAFYTSHLGILKQNSFLCENQDKAEGLLIDIEPLYVAAIFGLLAINIYTTNGARVNELLQIEYTKECIKLVQHKSKLIYSFHVVPKGHTDRQEYIVTEDIMKLFSEVREMLKEHYQSDKIPLVPYKLYVREHLFLEPRPYLFQYNGRLLNGRGINACMQLLMHGITCSTIEGEKVVVKSHGLRHGFATEAVNRFAIPLPVVGKIMHQKNLNVTGYYAEPTASQVIGLMNRYQDLAASFENMDEKRKDYPELDRELKKREEKVGIYNQVSGGICVTNDACPKNMACIGCQAKIPEPDKKEELLDILENTYRTEELYNKWNLQFELKKIRKMREDGQRELELIKGIEVYRKESNFRLEIVFPQKEKDE
ncbi:hypothetical protein CHH82_00875 [Bacillus velezensis]|nr:hypothetical protein CHH82_00875 [Bacillus velezensis]